MSLGGALTQSPSKVLWWIGSGCLIFGPLLLGTSAIDSSNVKDSAKHEA